MLKGVQSPAAGPTAIHRACCPGSAGCSLCKGLPSLIRGLQLGRPADCSLGNAGHGVKGVKSPVAGPIRRLLSSLKNINSGDPDPYLSVIGSPNQLTPFLCTGMWVQQSEAMFYAQACGFSNMLKIWGSRLDGFQVSHENMLPVEAPCLFCRLSGLARVT